VLKKLRLVTCSNITEADFCWLSSTRSNWLESSTHLCRNSLLTYEESKEVRKFYDHFLTKWE
jgi:hypothetical protein